MAMSVETVRANILIGLSIVRAKGEATPSSANTRLRIYNHIRFNDACSQDRKQSKNSSSGIATRIRDQRGPLDTLAVPLTQSIDRALQQGGCRMPMPVPLLVN